MVRLWPWLLSCPCSHCLWLSCFPATLPAGMMPVCYGDTFTSASSVKSQLLLIGLFPPHLVHDNASTLLMKVRQREGGTSCLLKMHEHKAAAKIAVSKGIKAVISLPVHSPHPETKPLQSPAGNHPSQRHLCGTSLRGGRAEGMVHLYSAIKALIFSFLSSSCGSWQSALLLPISHPLCSALQSLSTPSPLCRADVTVSPCPQLLQQGWVTCHPACLQVSDVFLAFPTAAGRHYSAQDPAAGKAMRAALLWGVMRRLQYVCLLCGFRRAAFPH